MNIKKNKEKFDLNQFRSQSVQDRETFLNIYYNQKQTSNAENSNPIKLELTSKISDLNRRLTKRLQISETISTPFTASASIPISSSGYSSADFLSNSVVTETLSNSAWSNETSSKQNNDSCFFDSIYETTSNDVDVGKTDDDHKSLYSLSNDINSFPCMTLSNRIDELVPSTVNSILPNREYSVDSQATVKPNGSSPTRFRNNTSLKDSDDFIFVI